MTEQQKAAYIQAMATCALIEAFGLMSENMQRHAVGSSMAYDETVFNNLIESYGIHHNAITIFFQN